MESCHHGNQVMSWPNQMRDMTSANIYEGGQLLWACSLLEFLKKTHLILQWRKLPVCRFLDHRTLAGVARSYLVRRGASHGY